MCEGQGDYASYLLRLIKSDRQGQPAWRASLESTRDGERLEFAGLEALVAFLIARFGSTERRCADKAGEAADFGDEPRCHFQSAK
jgi:hypothetical protein